MHTERLNWQKKHHQLKRLQNASPSTGQIRGITLCNNRHYMLVGANAIRIILLYIESRLIPPYFYLLLLLPFFIFVLAILQSDLLRLRFLLFSSLLFFFSVVSFIRSFAFLLLLRQNVHVLYLIISTNDKTTIWS